MRPVLIASRTPPDRVDKAAVRNWIVAGYELSRPHPYSKPPAVSEYVLARLCRQSGSFTLKEIKSLAQLDAYLDRRNIYASYLPDDEELAFWLPQDIPVEIRQQVWADQRLRGVWRLRGVHELPFLRSDGTEVTEPGYDVRTGFWATEPQERIALLPGRQHSLAGQLREIARGNGHILDMSTLSALLQHYGVRLEQRALQARVKQDEEELKLEGIKIEPAGRHPETRRALYRIVEIFNPSDPSRSLPSGETPEGLPPTLRDPSAE